MIPRKRQGRTSQFWRPTERQRPHEPYGLGDDAGSSFWRKPARPHAHRERPRLRTGDDALATTRASVRARWRQPSRSQVTGGKLALATRTGARRAARGFGGLLRRISTGAALSVGIPLALALALVVWLFTGAYWQARAVRIEGTSDPALLALIRAQRLTGCNAFRCDFSAASRAIASSPLVQGVSVSVMYPDTTVVRVTQRQTVALWRTQSQVWAVGADGVVIGSGDQAAAQRVAIVDDPAGVAFAGRTPQPGMRIDAALVTMASQLRMKAASAGLDPASLRYSAHDGLTLRATGGALVLFGGPTDALAMLTEIKAGSPAPALTPGPSPSLAQVSQGARLEVEAAASILARLAQTHTGASLIDVRWGTRPYYR